MNVIRIFKYVKFKTGKVRELEDYSYTSSFDRNLWFNSE